MNAADFRYAIKEAAAFATKGEPTNRDWRARSFIAGLSGYLKRDEPALAAVVWDLLGVSPERLRKAEESIDKRHAEARQQ